VALEAIALGKLDDDAIEEAAVEEAVQAEKNLRR